MSAATSSRRPEHLLAELHQLAAQHNPKPVDPELVARLRTKVAQTDPVIAIQRFARAMTSHPMEPFEIERINKAWDAWDAERDVHQKALKQMDLAIFVAGLLENDEALRNEIARLQELIPRPSTEIQ